jgi:urease accessory protein UreF
MDETLQILIQIQAAITECRRLANALPSEGAKVLLRIADDIEAQVREVANRSMDRNTPVPDLPADRHGKSHVAGAC